MNKTNEREWYREQRGSRLAVWVGMNLAVFVVYHKTDSILWTLVLGVVLNLIRKAPTLWELDRIEREIKQEQKELPSKNTRAAVR